MVGKRGPLSWKDFIKIDNGENVKIVLNIGKWYKLNEVGRYEVFATYSNGESGKDATVKVWTGLLKSNVILFDIASSGVR